MEQEHFFTGYCRVLDKSRMVTVESEDGQITEVDCCYHTCIHAPNCAIAKEIRLLTEKE